MKVTTKYLRMIGAWTDVIIEWTDYCKGTQCDKFIKQHLQTWKKNKKICLSNSSKEQSTVIIYRQINSLDCILLIQLCTDVSLGHIRTR